MVNKTASNRKVCTTGSQTLSSLPETTVYFVPVLPEMFSAHSCSGKRKFLFSIKSASTQLFCPLFLSHNNTSECFCILYSFSDCLAELLEYTLVIQPFEGHLGYS